MTLDEIRARARRAPGEWKEEPLEPLPLGVKAAPGSGTFLPRCGWLARLLGWFR